MASVMLPFFLPVGMKLDSLGLAVAGIVLFQGAYLAEVVRGGLQGIPRGQYEACQALGFGYWRTTGYVIMPQAIRKVIPGLVNNSIALLKDTTLVMVVGLFELLNIVSAGASDPAWLGSTAEGYVVVGIVFWTLCFAMSRYSQRLERSLRTEER
jgi:general L-amino acid transport system permease protein